MLVLSDHRVEDSGGLRTVCPTNNYLSLGQAYQSYTGANILVLGDNRVED